MAVDRRPPLGFCLAMVERHLVVSSDEMVDVEMLATALVARHQRTLIFRLLHYKLLLFVTLLLISI